MGGCSTLGSNVVTTVNPYKSGLEWTFEALPVPQIISWESSRAVEKGPGSIAPLRAELWPFKEGNCQKRMKIGPFFVNPSSNAHISGLEWSFAKIQKPQIISWALASHRKRIQVNCTSGSRAMAVQRGQPSVEFLHDSSMFQE